MPHRRIRRGHMVEAVHDLRRRTSGQVAHGATGDQPHHQLDAFAAGLAHIVDVRHGRLALGVGDQPIEERIVELAVDQPGARSLQLMAHAAGAPDLHLEVIVVALDRLADGLAQVQATPARRHRVLHHVHRERDHRTGPGLRLAAHQRQWHRQAVVHIHLVDDGEVEVLLDHRLGDVGRQFGMADHPGHGPGSPAFVRRIEGRRRADGEGRDHVEAERGGVVVVDQEDHVRTVVLHPLLRKFIALEHPLPIGFPALAAVERSADGRDMGGVDAGGDAGHYLFSPDFSPMRRLPSIERPPATIMSRYCSSLMPVMLPAICWKLLPSVAPILARK